MIKKIGVLALSLVMLGTLALPVGIAAEEEPEPFLYDAVDISWIDPSKPMVAFTFDDGPRGVGSDSNADKIQDALTEYGAHATFFYIGSEINSEAKENEIKQAVERGFEVANHSWGWSSLTSMEPEAVAKSIEDTDAKLTELTGFSNFLFRAPNLSTNAMVFDTIKKPFIHCAIDTQDWNRKSTEEIIERAKAAKDGDIILMHENQNNTPPAVPELLKYFTEKGWQVVSVSELFAASNVAMEASKLYSNCPPDQRTPPEPPPADEPADWAAADVARAIEENLVPTELQSKYTAEITRAEFCALAVSLYEGFMQKDITERAAFADTTDINVEKMAGLGVVEGDGENFNPDDTFNRQMAARLFVNLLGTMEIGLPDGAADFPDAGDIAGWAIEAVGQVQAAGIIQGNSEGLFNPAGKFSRQSGIILALNVWDYLQAE
ncbi:MAG: polysaccharide deacetylase family protein [Oscillospiraceae bacterium]|jgi:peptidoglycan/xylan/chitin deacetylase (PgdA/CDA1 family)|nr:polysaccharide deacetylase family protein [Oscillospiraceae bacterium]